MLRTAIVSCLLFVFLPTSWGDEPARVTVIKPRVDLRNGDKIIDSAEFGQNFDVAKIEGNLVWIARRTASLSRDDVMPYDETVDHFTEALHKEIQAANKQGIAEQYRMRGLIWLGRGEAAIAVSDFTDAIAIQTRDPKLLLLRGRALRELARSLREDGPPRGAYSSSSSEASSAIREAMVRSIGEREDERALADFNEAIRLDPKNPVAYFERGKFHLSLSESDVASKAIADFSEAIRRDPKFVEALSSRASAYTNRRDHAKAYADLTAALAIAPNDPEFYSARAANSTAQGKLPEAVVDYTAALQIDPQFSHALFARASLYKQLNELDKFIADAEAATKIDPSFASLGLECCRIWYARGEGERVVQFLESYLKSDGVGNRTIMRNSNAYQAHLMLAWIRSTCVNDKLRDSKTAQEHLAAIEGGSNAESSALRYFTVAAAVSAESGKFDEAARLQQQANESALRGGRARAGFGGFGGARAGNPARQAFPVPPPEPAPARAAEQPTAGYKPFELDAETNEIRLHHYQVMKPYRDEQKTLP